MNTEPLQTHSLPEQGILFSVNQNLFAMDLSIIKEVIFPDTRPAQLPLSPPFVKGLLQSRNRVYSVIHLSLTEDYETTEESRLILLEQNNHALALYVDELHTIFSFQEESITQTNIPIEITDLVDLSIETPLGQAFYLDLQTLYAKLIAQANQLDLA